MNSCVPARANALDACKVPRRLSAFHTAPRSNERKAPCEEMQGAQIRVPDEPGSRNSDRMPRCRCPFVEAGRSNISDHVHTTMLSATSTVLPEQRTSSGCRLCEAYRPPGPDFPTTQRAQRQACTQGSQSSGSSSFSFIKITGSYSGSVPRKLSAKRTVRVFKVDWLGVACPQENATFSVGQAPGNRCPSRHRFRPTRFRRVPAAAQRAARRVPARRFAMVSRRHGPPFSVDRPCPDSGAASRLGRRSSGINVPRVAGGRRTSIRRQAA